jgi:hypothetical protein
LNVILMAGQAGSGLLLSTMLMPEAAERRLKVALCVYEEVRARHDRLAAPQARRHFDVAVGALAELHLARLEHALAAAHQYDLAGAAVEHRGVGHREHLVRVAGGEFGVGIHRGLEQPARIGELDTHTSCARGRLERRIDERHLAGEFASGIRGDAHRRRLAGTHQAEILLGELGDEPDRR